jgi:hypothetical protein
MPLAVNMWKFYHFQLDALGDGKHPFSDSAANSRLMAGIRVAHPLFFKLQRRSIFPRVAAYTYLKPCERFSIIRPWSGRGRTESGFYPRYCQDVPRGANVQSPRWARKFSYEIPHQVQNNSDKRSRMNGRFLGSTPLFQSCTRVHRRSLGQKEAGVAVSIGCQPWMAKHWADQLHMLFIPTIGR